MEIVKRKTQRGKVREGEQARKMLIWNREREKLYEPASSIKYEHVIEGQK